MISALRIAALWIAISAAILLGHHVSSAQISLPFPNSGRASPIGSPTTLINTGSSSGGTTQITGTTTGATTAAVVAVYCVQWNASTGATFGVLNLSDGTNSFTKAKEQLSSDTFGGTSIWYNVNPTGVSSGATVTVNFTANSAGANLTLQGIQVTGVSALDVTAGAGASATSVTVPTGTLGFAREIIIGCASNAGSGTYSGASGFASAMTPRVQSSTTSGMDTKVVASTATSNYVPTFSNSARISGALATFR